MAEEMQGRVQKAVDKMVQDIDKEHLRKLQLQMHLCAAKCCENDSGSMEQIHRCVEQCSMPVSRAQHVVQSELEHLQNRLQRCIQGCQDNIQDKVGPNTTEAEVTKYKKDFELCASNCVENVIGLIPTYLKKIKSSIPK